MTGLDRRRFILRGLGLVGAAALGRAASAYPTSMWLGNQNPKHIQWTLKHYLNWYQKTVFDFNAVMTGDEFEIVQTALQETTAWDTRLDERHWIDHVYFGIEVDGDSSRGGRLAIAVPAASRQTRRLLEKYLSHRNLKSYLAEPGQELAGLGWDFGAKIFKLYFATDPARCRRGDLLEFMDKFDEGYLARRWTALRFSGQKLVETRAYAIMREPRLDHGSDSNLFALSDALVQRMDIQTSAGPQPPLLRVKSVPIMGMGRGFFMAANAQQMEFRFTPDSIRYWNKDRAVLYYP